MVKQFRRNWADTIGHTEKISSGQTFTAILNLRCNVDLECIIPFFHRTLRLMMLYYQTKFGCKPTSSLENTTEIVIVWIYKPSLWPWHWTQKTNFSAWHSGLWNQVWQQNVLWFIRYWPDKHSLTFYTFAVTLTLKAVIPFFHSLWCCTTKPNLVANQPAV